MASGLETSVFAELGDALIDLYGVVNDLRFRHIRDIFGNSSFVEANNRALKFLDITRELEGLRYLDYKRTYQGIIHEAEMINSKELKYKRGRRK